MAIVLSSLLARLDPRKIVPPGSRHRRRGTRCQARVDPEQGSADSNRPVPGDLRDPRVGAVHCSPGSVLVYSSAYASSGHFSSSPVPCSKSYTLLRLEYVENLTKQQADCYTKLR